MKRFTLPFIIDQQVPRAIQLHPTHLILFFVDSEKRNIHKNV